MYVCRNIKARSRSHCYGGKVISITYSKCVSVALVIQYATRMRRIVICSPLAEMCFFFQISHKLQDFPKNVTEHKIVCFDLLYKFCLIYFSFQEEFREILLKMYTGFI